MTPLENKLFKSIFAKVRGKRILDLGGLDFGRVEYLLNRGNYVAVVDQEVIELKKARKYFTSDRVRFYQSDLMTIEGLGEPFDFVIFIGDALLELKNKEDFRLALQRAIKNLNKSGTLVIGVTNKTNLERNEIVATNPQVSKDGKRATFSFRTFVGEILLEEVLNLVKTVKGWEVGSQTMSSLGLRREDFEEAFKLWKIKDFHFYGDRLGLPFRSKSSELLICLIGPISLNEVLRI